MLLKNNMNKELDIHKINTFLDKFVRGVYGVDMYIANNRYAGTVPHIIIYPYKFLKNSPEYDPSFIELTNKAKAEKIFSDTMKYMGIDAEKSFNDEIVYTVSKNVGSYLEKYIKDIEYLTPMFFETDYLPEEFRGRVKDTNVKHHKTWFNGGFNSHYDADRYIEPHMSVAFQVSKEAESFLGAFNDEYKDYLSNNMNVDDQIRTWFNDFSKL